MGEGVYHSLLQYIAVCCICCSMLQNFPVRCSMLQYVAACCISCSILQCVIYFAVHRS